MSESEEPLQQQSGKESVPVSDIGAAFTHAREDLGMSIEDAAHQLRLSARQLHALEANDYSGLPGATFIRGFVRNYARLLRLDPEPLLSALGTHTAEAARHAITLQSEDIAISNRDKRLWLPYVTASVMVGILLGSWMLYMDYRESHPAVKHADTVPVPGNSAGGYSPESVTLPSVDAGADTPAPVPAPASAPEKPVASKPVPAPVAAIPPPVAARPATPPAAGIARLKFVFSQQSWVRVVDRDGKEIFHKTAPAGTEDIVEGVPPLKMEVGNAAGVQITFNDKAVDLVPHTKANVARFSLE